MSDELPGIDLARLQSFLDEHCPGLLKGALSAKLIAGGRSNLTYAITDGVGEWVARRPPLGHVLDTAHDMGREFRVMSALGSSEVPVPATLAFCEDTDVLGVPFYVMEKISGTAYRSADQLVPLGPDRTRAISERMVDTLAMLHRVDPYAVGLGGFGRPEGFLSRQVKRWRKQLDSSRSRPLAGVEDLYDALVGQVPIQSPPAIVHGDYRLDNLLVEQDDQVAAVLDWEMATLGDPLTDVALLMAYTGLSELEGSDTVTDVAKAAGFLSSEEILVRYGEQSDRDLSDIDFYLAFAHFKLAVIIEGIHYRFIQGGTVGAGFDRIGAIVEPLVAKGLTALRVN